MKQKKYFHYVDEAKYFNGCWELKPSQMLLDDMKLKSVPFFNINAIRLSSINSLKILELLSYLQCQNTELNIPIEILRNTLFGNNSTSYLKYATLKDRIILPSLQRIKKGCNEEYQLKEIKRGRSVYSVQFIPSEGDRGTGSSSQCERDCVELNKRLIYKKKM